MKIFYAIKWQTLQFFILNDVVKSLPLNYRHMTFTNSNKNFLENYESKILSYYNMMEFQILTITLN